MKKVLALLLVLLMVASFAACGQSGNNSSTPSSKAENSESSGQESSEVQEDSQASSEGNSGEVVTIRMGGWGDFNTEHEAGTEGMAEAIGVEVEFQKYPTDSAFWDNLPAQIAAKTAPDFIALTNELYLPYIKDGLIVPIDQYIEDGTITCWDKVGQNVKDIWTIDGQIYGVPWHQTPAVFAINMDLWEEAELTEADLPETWEDVLEACKVFKDKLGMTGLCFNTQEFHFTQYCLSYGGGWGLGKTIDTPENAAALQFIIDAYRQGYVVTPKELGVSYDGNVVMSGDAAMSTGGTWYVNDFMRNAPDVNVKYITIPHAEGKNDVSGTFHAPCYAILKGGSHEKETAQAINYMMNDKLFDHFCDIGYIPADPDYFETFKERQPELASLVDTVPKSNGFGYPAAGKKFADALISKMEEALFNSDSTVTGAQIVKELQEEFGE